MKEVASAFLTETKLSPQKYPARPYPTENMSCNACVLKEIGLAQAFVPMQPYETPSSPVQSLVCGTAFSALSMPYKAGTHILWNRKEVGE